MASNPKSKNFDFYLTAASPCNYLPGRQATTLFVDPFATMNMQVYSTLANHGFRRSGEHIYKPHCKGCNACLPARIPADAFVSDRSQKRVWKRNHDVEVSATKPRFTPEHFDVYRRYLDSRHKGGGMDNPDPEQYLSFLTSTWSNTCFYEFRARQQLLAVAVVDRLEDGLSAVYTFYEPDGPERSLGTFAILWQIEETRRLGLPFLYLGYWIKECRKMSYKSRYRPLEVLRNGVWQTSDPASD